jgi:hypothetical protein
LGPPAMASARIVCGVPPEGLGVDPLEREADFFIPRWVVSIRVGAISRTFAAAVVARAGMWVGPLRGGGNYIL